MIGKEQLLAKLKEFTGNIRQFQKMTATGSVPDALRHQYYKLCQKNKTVIDQIHQIFSQFYSSKQKDMGVDKLHKQFHSLLKNYNFELKKEEQREEKEIRELRKTYNKLRESAQSIRMKSRQMSQSESESERGAQFEMVEINQETYHYERMIQIKEQEINTIKERMHDALKVQQEMQFMVNEQGERLDLAEGHLEDANRNVHDAQEMLIDAKEQHIISRKRQACIFGIILCVILVAVIFIAVKYG